MFMIEWRKFCAKLREAACWPVGCFAQHVAVKVFGRLIKESKYVAIERAERKPQTFTYTESDRRRLIYLCLKNRGCHGAAVFELTN